MSLEDIPKLLKVERLTQGLTLHQLALKSHVSLSLIESIEHGDVNISLKTLFKLMKALNIHLDINQKLG